MKINKLMIGVVLGFVILAGFNIAQGYPMDNIGFSIVLDGFNITRHINQTNVTNTNYYNASWDCSGKENYVYKYETNGTYYCDADNTSAGTDTNSSTACVGTHSYLDGEGNCDVVYNDTDTNTNADTFCTGTRAYLDGEGNCDVVYNDTDTDTTYTCADWTGCDVNSSVYLDGHGSVYYLDDTNTNAGTICGAGEFLNGDGSCDTGFLDADGSDDDQPDSDAEVPNNITIESSHNITTDANVKINEDLKYCLQANCSSYIMDNGSHIVIHKG